MAPATAPATATAPGSPAAASDAPPNTVKIEEAGPATRKLTITIPAQAVTARLEESMATMATQTELPGFRKGKAPRALLEKRFGTALRDEARNQLIADAYTKAIEEHQIKPVGEPEPDDTLKDLKVESGKPLTFSVMVEVVPEFALPPLEGIAIKRPVLEIADKHIQDEIDRLCRQAGTAQRIDGPFQSGDTLLGHATVTKEGAAEPIFQTEAAAITVPGKATDGRGQVLGLLIDGMDKMLIGHAVGQTIVFHTTGPEAHEREDIRGAKLTIEFRPREAQRVEPATIEQVVTGYGMESQDNLRAQIRLALEQRRDVEQQSAMREQAADHLIRSIEFELPEKLSAAQVMRTLERQRIELLYRGVSPEEVETRLAQMRGEAETLTRNRLKLVFIVARLAEEFKVAVSEQEINGRIAAIAMQRGERPAALRAELARQGRLQEIADQIREHKALDRLVHKAKVTDITAAEWNKLVAEQSAAASARRGAPRPAATRPATRAPAKAADGEDDKPARKPEKKASAEKSKKSPPSRSSASSKKKSK
jgi:trigger factor